MKIPLNTGSHEGETPSDQKLRKLSADLTAARRNDWEARDRIISSFTPLLRKLAEQHTADAAQRARLIEAGKAGIVTAIRKFNPDQGAERFQLFALEFIEKQMDRKPSSGGILSRLFGSR